MPKTPKNFPVQNTTGHSPHSELIEIVGRGGLGAGSHNVLDIIAARVVERSHIPLVVLDGTRPENLSEALLAGQLDGSIVSETKKKILPL